MSEGAAREVAAAERELNRESWDLLAEWHGQDAYYDSNALIAGASTLIAEEEEALRIAIGDDLQNKSVLHLQCHIGFDAITFARRGARVTGIDFSPVALAKAKALATTCCVDVEWICADVLALPATLNQQFDLVWATMGIMCWIGDLNAWMAGVRSVLKPGGRLVLVDGFGINDSHAAAEKPERRYIEAGWDYASPQRTGPQVQFKHNLGSIVAIARAEGLDVVLLEQHDAVSADLRVSKVLREDDGYYRRRTDGVAEPYLFTMIASRREHGTE